MCCFVRLLSYSMTDPRVRLNYVFPFQIVDENETTLYILTKGLEYYRLPLKRLVVNKLYNY